jgi:hypothetical protein
MQHVKGQFKSYRVVSKVHLGSLEMDLEKNQVVEYDGTTMRIGSNEHNIGMLTAAIKVGWLVPEGQEGSNVSKPAGITIGKQDGSRAAISVAVSDEEKDMGTLDSVRADGAPPTHSARNAGTRNDDDGQVVGRMKVSAKAEPIKLDGSDRQVVQKLDNGGRSGVDPVKGATATGDVDEALTGESLEEILPNAASTEIPAAGVSGEGMGDQSEARARSITATDELPSGIGGEESGVVVANVKAPEPEEQGAPSASDPVEAPASDPVEDKAVRLAKLEMAKQLVPGFDWDFNVQYARRAKIAVEKYGSDLRMINVILSIETQAVRKNILHRLYGK